MDDPTIVLPDDVWNKERYDEIEGKLTPFLRGCGYNPKKDVVFLPISGLFGSNMRQAVDPAKCPWYKGETLFEILDAIEPGNRDPYAPFRMPIMNKYKDMGTMVMGKSEAGVVKKGDSLIVMPNKYVNSFEWLISRFWMLLDVADFVACMFCLCAGFRSRLPPSIVMRWK